VLGRTTHPLGIEPARADEAAFTAPYLVIEGVYSVPDRSPLTAVDSPGARIGVINLRCE
jgi:polar amino acid transport system substrate-binding protein